MRSNKIIKKKIELTVWAGRIHAPLFVHPDYFVYKHCTLDNVF